MAIPQGRLSTIPVQGLILEPEDRPYYGMISYERGPIGIEDMSQGLLYQNWTMTWDPNTFNLILTPETTGNPSIALNVPDITYFTFTFDQSGRVSIAYTTTTSSYLYWYDTALGYTTITDLGTDVSSPTINLDDKRGTQDTVNDMMLWYLKGTPGNYFLYSLLQRERFLIEHLQGTGFTEGNILTVGMGDNLRVHLRLSGDNPLPIPNPLTGLTPEQILGIVNNSASLGYISLYQFPQLTFDAVFGQSIDAGDTTQVIPTGVSMSFVATTPNMRFKIEHSLGDAGAVTLLMCFPNGLVTGSNTYVGVALDPLAYLPIQPGSPYVLMIASDTGFAKITKEIIS